MQNRAGSTEIFCGLENIPAMLWGFNERNFSNFPEGIKISRPLQILLCGRFPRKLSEQNFRLNFIRR